MMIVRRNDKLAVLPMGAYTRRRLNAMGIDTVGALFDAPEEMLEELGQARRLVEQMARGDGETGLLEWGMVLPGRRGRLYWSLDEHGLLTVYGGGKMADYTREHPAPWWPLRQEIRALRIEEQVENVGAMAFAGCGALTRVTLSEHVRRIGANSFRDCAALERVESAREMVHWRTAGEGQTAVGMDAFAGTPWEKREYVIFRIQDGILMEYRGDETRVEIPEGVCEIAPMVFEGKPLTEVALPRTLERIGACAFRGTKLREVTLPKKLALVEEWAFSDIPTLDRVIIRNKKMKTAQGTFARTPAAEQSISVRGRWPSLLALNDREEPGITCARRLVVGDAPGHKIGVPGFATRRAWRKRLKAGELLLRIVPDAEDRYVECVDAFYIHPYYGLSRLRVEPCWGSSGCVEPWRDEEYRFDSLEKERVDLTGLRRPGKIQWYTMPYSRYSEYDKPLLLVDEWIRARPQYDLHTLEQRINDWWPGPEDDEPCSPEQGSCICA